MTWLSLKVLELDRAEALARSQAALEESVNLALWRMDSFLTPLLAQEAARSPLSLQAFYRPLSAEPSKSAALSLSPLLLQTPDLVRLHFQVTASGQWSSPQCPSIEARPWALSAGVSSSTLEAREHLLEDLQRKVACEELLKQTSATMFPTWEPNTLAWGQEIWGEHALSAQIVANSLDYNPASQNANKDQTAVGSDSFPTAGSVKDRQQPVALKGENELLFRNRALQAYAQQQVRDQRMQAHLESPQPPVAVKEGASRSFWIGDKLLLARRVQLGDELLVQGCWLDWPAIEKRLRADVVDLLPDVSFAPVNDQNAVLAGRVLATLPIRVIVPPASVEPRSGSPLRLALTVAWVCLAIASIATAGLLGGAISLSERRAAFVAAVTHELRTPLTTFRMYSEMLARDMAPPDRRQEYLDTLQNEADRLAHLVENVLAYARLERGRRVGCLQPIAISELLSEWTPRLAERAAQADMHLAPSTAPSASTAVVTTDPAIVGQILVNLVDNAAKYAAKSAKRRIDLTCRLHNNAVQIRIRDYGPGLPPSKRRRLFHPFSKTVQEAAVTAPGIGLGLALCRRLARELGGSLKVEETIGEGATFVLEIPLADA